MHRNHFLTAVFSLLAVAAAADWRPAAIDLAAGYAPPAPAAAYAGAFPPVAFTPAVGARDPSLLSALVTNPAAVTLHLAAGPVYLRSFRPAAVSPASATAAVIAYAVTSGVTFALGTFTNGAAAWTAGLWLQSGDSLAAKATNSASARCYASIQTTRPAWTSDAPAIVRSVQPSALLPTNAVVTLSAVTSGVAVAEYATWTGATPAAWTTGLTLAPGDTLSLNVAGATNAVSVALVSQPLAVYSNAVAAACRLVSASAGAVLPVSINSFVSLYAVTNGVRVALASFTNGAAAWADGIVMAAGDVIGIDSALVTNAVAVTLAVAAARAPNFAPASEPDAVRVHSLRLAGTVLPAETAATLVYTPWSGVATNLAVLTDGPYVPETALTLYPGDTLTVSAPDATNSVTARAHAERFALP